MTDKAWKKVWREWLQARFGDRLDGETLETVIQDAELMRGFGAALSTLRLDNGQSPFSYLLPRLTDKTS